MVAAPALDEGTRDTLYADLEKIPAPWLSFLHDYGLQIAALADGETLADSPALRKFAVTDLPAWRDIVHQTLPAALAQVGPSETLVDNLHQWLTEQKAPFRVATHSEPVDVDSLAAQRKVPAHRVAEWKAEFLELNAPWSKFAGGHLTTTHGIALLPPVPTDSGPIADDVYQGAVSTSAEYVGESLGLNRGADQLVLLHPRYLPAVAPEIGEYRVAIHEVGHALDYALEGLPDSTGYGKLHRERVQGWFKRDQERNVWTSERAADSPREYFAEAVEAFLTEPGKVDFRPDNHRGQLRVLNPELETYLDTLFGSQPGSDWISHPPAPVGVPPGFPDPDHDPIRLA